MVDWPWVKKSKTNAEDHLERAGLKVVRDDWVNNRIATQQELYEKLNAPYPEDELEALKEMRNRIHFVMNVLRTSGIPWGRSGDNEAARIAKGIDVVEKLMMFTLDYVDYFQNLFAAGAEKMKTRMDLVNRRNIMRKLRYFVEYMAINPALRVLDRCWYGLDVTPQTPIVIQAPIMQSGFGLPLRQYDMGSPSETKASTSASDETPEVLRRRR